jgi:hypothetical protein
MVLRWLALTPVAVYSAVDKKPKPDSPPTQANPRSASVITFASYKDAKNIS